ncbi:hypothetical protein VHUM_01198 [Vanrija humicola]|uniref:Aconitase X catalytic domain-containing protein n=1 Tax=Vanrija humicola TaxID=5417 RepID=A0A7D8ZTL5_VANHU|nr:hypothetical protein VHUM_01198 [Vanrija humicola]
MTRTCDSGCATACHDPTTASCKAPATATNTSALPRGAVPAPTSPHFLVPGRAAAPLLYSNTALSFWGGVDATTGEVIDVTHPLKGRSLAGNVLAIPRGRGSCSGSLVLLELAVNGCAPAALLLEEADQILALGSIVADTIFGARVPVAVLGERFATLPTSGDVELDGSRLVIKSASGSPRRMVIPLAQPADSVRLTEADEALLAGARGEGAAQAMAINRAIAALYGAEAFVDITQVHLDGVFYTGPAALRFVQHFASIGAGVAVPTTLNAVSVDLERWRALGIDSTLGEEGTKLADAYLSMGGDGASMTCAPYLLPSAPSLGEQVAWGESNAVIFCNSVLGARTQKYPDLLDLCIALTGRAPLAGVHIEAERVPTLALRLAPALAGVDDQLLWPLVGYHLGRVSGARVAIVYGLDKRTPRTSDLKALAAAFGTTSSSPMFHIEGVTPEAPVGRFPPPSSVQEITAADLLDAWRTLNTGARGPTPISVVALGNPHFALDEFEQLARLVEGRKRTARVTITAGRAVTVQAEEKGYLAPLAAYGADIIHDMCWCFAPRAGESGIVTADDRFLVTSSGKYAHYGPGILGRPVLLANLAACVDAAESGTIDVRPPAWLGGADVEVGEEP